MTDSGGIPAHEIADAQAAGARRPADLGQSIGGERVAAGARGRAVSPAFDSYHPPDRALIDDCVHCGFCLPTCPTYVLWGEEMDSPRGRIYLMREGLEGEPMSGVMVQHMDRCLGCLACVTACPSGVQYGPLLEATRAQVERRYPRGLPDRLYRALLFQFFPYPERLRMLLPVLRLWQRTGLRSAVRRSRLYERVPARLRTLDALAPPVTGRQEAVAAVTPALGEERLRVGLLLGCVQRAFFSDVNAATVRVLAAEGCAVVAPPGQGCCGALSEHTGREAEAAAFARRLIDTFEQEQVDVIAVNVAGCGSHMKEYAHLLRDDPRYAARARRFAKRVRDVSEILAELPPRADYGSLSTSAVYHDACHLAHGQGIRSQPRELLRRIPGLDLREVPREREICCGSAGTYNLLQPEAAAELGERKACAVLDAGAEVLVTANPGCHLQITASARALGHELRAMHVMEMLDASIAAGDALGVVQED
jgi:glycolate oxidase iron-sulfur subunit